MPDPYWPLHEAARQAGAFQKVALAHLDRPCPERLAQALGELRKALEELGPATP
jgi:hypothetical protein